MTDIASYRSGFEDGLDVCYKLIEEDVRVGTESREELLRFIHQVRRSKAEKILEDLEMYRTPVPRITARVDAKRARRVLSGRGGRRPGASRRTPSSSPRA